MPEVLRVVINGDAWKIVVFESDSFVKRFGDDIAAFCEPKTKQIIFNEDEIDLVTVRHELVHAYYYYSSTYSANLDAHQVEEVFCELMSTQGPKIFRQASFIYKELKK